MGNGLSAYSSKTIPRVRRIGKLVILKGKVKNSTTWNLHDSFLTIPNGFRPSNEKESIQKGYAFGVYRLTVKTDDVCVVDCITDGKGGTSVKYPVGSFYSISDIWFIE